MFTPALTRRPSVAASLEAGPSVATIFVLRCMQFTPVSDREITVVLLLLQIGIDQASRWDRTGTPVRHG
ncbi:hypothetical protein GCM10010971_10750 [Silvimonas amylolytica]|uniref:Uncharacterized protein n=1 Tax=Silvimonas amylolytica TaxID=449663 RepID=A0ABQ2PIQ2_9NEIS|nr:hypothetical protein GCM10010971_10750 [Silvimonas amylolytica]